LRIKARHHLRDDAVKKVLDSLKASFGEDVGAAFAGKTLEIAETDETQEFILVNGQPWLFTVEDSVYFPTVR
jgi:predicted ribosome-associated RNA-binding protein Tma20